MRDSARSARVDSFSRRSARIADRFLSTSSGVVVLLMAWFAASHLGWMSDRILPDPVRVYHSLATDFQSTALWSAVTLTVQTSLIGLAIGVISGTVLAFALSERRTRWLYELVRPYLAFLNSTPRIVLVPFFLLAFGIGPASRIALSVSLVFFVMFFGVFGAIHAIPSAYLRSARVMGASRLDAWRLIIFPGVLPGFFDALRISVSLALLGVVVGEIVGTPSGLGGLIRTRGDQYDLPGLFSGLVVLGALSGAAIGLLGWLARRAMRWR